MIKRQIRHARAVGLWTDRIKTISMRRSMYLADIERASNIRGAFVQIYGQGECPLTR